MSRTSQAVLTVLALVAAAACGGGGNGQIGSPTGSTTVISASTGSAGPSGATVTITASGVSPQQVTVNVGQSVTFINSDTRVHEMASDPHPIHGTCPGIENGLGTLSVGQTKLTMGFANAGTCGYHDHLNSGTPNLQGSIIIR